jgi:hypothetical protein
MSKQLWVMLALSMLVASLRWHATLISHAIEARVGCDGRCTSGAPTNTASSTLTGSSRRIERRAANIVGTSALCECW